MKRLLFTLAAALVVLTTSAAVKFTINGKAPASMNGQKIYLSVISSKNRTPQDSALIANGMFKFSGTVNTTDIAVVYSRSKTERPKVVYSVVGEAPVTIDFTAPKPTVKGGMLNARMTQYNEEMNGLEKKAEDLKLNNLAKEYRDSTTTETRKAEIEKIFDNFNNEELDISKKYINQNLNNVLGAYIFVSKANDLGEEEMSAIYAKAGKAFKEYPLVVSIAKQIEASKLRSTGKTYTDFEMADPQGAMHKLSEFVGKGKYVMVDFWASWCGPCRAEMPNVKAAYAKYHDKGFDIVGISLDNKKEAWTGAIEKLGMTWHQLSDLQGWKNAAAQKYGVNAIPFTMLLDPNGKIIATNLRGEELDKKLGELLK